MMYVYFMQNVKPVCNNIAFMNASKSKLEVKLENRTPILYALLSSV